MASRWLISICGIGDGNRKRSVISWDLSKDDCPADLALTAAHIGVSVRVMSDKSSPRSERIMTRLSLKDYQALREIAAKERRSMSDWVRLALADMIASKCAGPK